MATASDYGLGGILDGLNNYEDLLRARLAVAMDKIMKDLAAEAIADHPYTDQTGFNTASIKGGLGEITEDLITGYLSAGMEYSYWLETIKEGKYAYLAPVIERNKAKVMAIFSAIVART